MPDNRKPNAPPSAGGRPIVLCALCGGIAAYKAVDVVSQLVKSDFEVHVVMSDAAQEFVKPLTLQALIGRHVTTGMFASPEEDARERIYPHLYPASEADLFVVLPATADMIAKIAGGWADDVVAGSAVALSPQCHRFFCPAMNVQMWNQPETQENTHKLESAGWRRIGPGTGPLACGTEGEGRMAEPADITAVLVEALTRSRDLSGKRVLVLSGPTREHLDPVRYMSNASTGKMGKALAEEAVAMGATVDFVTGPIPQSSLPLGPRILVHPVTSARDMLAAAEPLSEGADVVLFAAAVADYEPRERSEEKRPKESSDVDLKLTATPDIAATLSSHKRSGQVMVGFALQDKQDEKAARTKLELKNLDGIVLNSPEAIGADVATYRYLSAREKDQTFAAWGELGKRACAIRILAEAAEMLEELGPA